MSLEHAMHSVVGSDGFVDLIDVMGSDADIVNAARVSTSGSTVFECGEKEENLINYLMWNQHTTPFEMCELKFYVRVPMDTWRQWIRHRTASVCEYSTRYREAINAQDRPACFRNQASSNKQGSDGVLADHKTPYAEVTYNYAIQAAASAYQNLLGIGVAKEQARRVLPLCTYTEAYWKIDLHNLLHFLELRLHPHAQKEIRDYAQAISMMVAVVFPITHKHFIAYIKAKSEFMAERKKVI